MKKIIYLSSIFTLSLVLYGCVPSYVISLEGIVLSNLTGEPISGALVTLKSRDITVTTDSLGFFDLTEFGHGRPSRRIYSIRKEGYKDFEVEFTSTRSKSITIVVRSEKYSKDYAKRGNSVIFYMDIDNDDLDFENYLKVGRVLSNLTGEPIRGALVTLESKNTTVITDSFGFFHLIEFGHGKPSGHIYSIRKEGYKDFEVEFTFTNSESITAVKRELKNYDLGGKRFYPDSTNLLTFSYVVRFEKYSKDYAKRGDSVVFYMDIDDDDLDFENYLERRWDITDRWVIK